MDAVPGESGGLADAVDQDGTDRMRRMGPIGRIRPDQTKSNLCPGISELVSQ
jgi:hypothetical protein